MGADEQPEGRVEGGGPPSTYILPYCPCADGDTFMILGQHFYDTCVGTICLYVADTAQLLRLWGFIFKQVDKKGGRNFNRTVSGTGIKLQAK